MADGRAFQAEAVVALAELLGVPLRPEHVDDVALAWRMMAPHRALVTAQALGPTAEPAALFEP
jgi:hypothetical protein